MLNLYEGFLGQGPILLATRLAFSLSFNPMSSEIGHTGPKGKFKGKGKGKMDSMKGKTPPTEVQDETPPNVEEKPNIMEKGKTDFVKGKTVIAKGKGKGKMDFMKGKKGKTTPTEVQDETPPNVEETPNIMEKGTDFVKGKTVIAKGKGKMDFMKGKKGKTTPTEVQDETPPNVEETPNIMEKGTDFVKGKTVIAKGKGKGKMDSMKGKTPPTEVQDKTPPNIEETPNIMEKGKTDFVKGKTVIAKGKGKGKMDFMKGKKGKTTPTAVQDETPPNVEETPNIMEKGTDFVKGKTGTAKGKGKGKMDVAKGKTTPTEVQDETPPPNVEENPNIMEKENDHDFVKGKDTAKGKGKMDFKKGKTDMAEKVDTPNESKGEEAAVTTCGALPWDLEGLLDTLKHVDRDGIWDFMMQVPEDEWVSSMIDQGKKHNLFDGFISHYVQENEFNPRFWTFGDPVNSDPIEDLTELCHYLLTATGTTSTEKQDIWWAGDSILCLG